MNDERLTWYAKTIWETSRADEGTISATGANHVARAVMAVADTEYAMIQAGAAELAEKVERVKALHTRTYPTASDEAHGTNPECWCGDHWPCETRAALDDAS